MNCQNLHEVFQHARTGTALMSRDSDIYYHISAEYQGYDAFSFNMKDYQRILTEKATSLINLHEMKMISGGSLKLSKIMKFFKKYSLPKLEGFEGNLGARPCPVDFLELGVYSLEDYYLLLKLDIFGLKNPTIILENYSDVYEVLVRNPKHGGLAHDTIISAEAFEHLEKFYQLLANNQELCLHMNDVLAKNPLFPFIIV
jgi:hypothetical protein